MPTIPIARHRFAVRLALFYGATFALLGTYQPFFPLWLKASGLESGWIGIVAATPTLVRLVAVPLVTRMAERHHAIRGAMLATAVLTFLGFATLGNMQGTLAIVLTLGLTACAWTPMVPLTDAYALRGVAVHRINYGPIRLWGLAAYMAGALTAGWLASRFAPEMLIWVIAGAAGLGALAGLLIEPLDPPARPEGAPSRASALLGNPAFLAVLASAALIQGSHAAYYTFSAIAWQATGLDSATISMLWAICIVAEIVLFALSPRLDIPPTVLIICGGAAAALRWAMTAQEPSIVILAFIQTLHALSFGATLLGTMALMSRLVPAHIGASAQGYLAVSSGLVTAAVSILCGQAYGYYGLSIYYGMALMGLAGSGLMLVMRSTIERTVRKLAP